MLTKSESKFIKPRHFKSTQTTLSPFIEALKKLNTLNNEGQARKSDVKQLMKTILTDDDDIDELFSTAFQLGGARITCRSTKRHVRQPVRNQTFIDQSIIKWVQYTCVSTVKFQSSFNSFTVLKFKKNVFSVICKSFRAGYCSAIARQR
jgi:hypothetical protein